MDQAGVDGLRLLDWSAKLSDPNIARTRVVILTLICSITLLMAFESRPATLDREEVKLTASNGAALDYFGWSVAISGNTAIVGALTRHAAYIFVRNGATWSLQQTLTTNVGFGQSVAISGNTAIVGGGDAAYVFVRWGTEWSLQKTLTVTDGGGSTSFGWSVALSGDTAVVGNPYANVGANGHQGLAYVFVRTGQTWSSPQTLPQISGESPDLFGYSVAISGDTVIVGVPGDNVVGDSLTQEGSAYVFIRSGTTWSYESFLTANGSFAFGGSVGISGNTAIVGGILGNFSNTAYVFERSGTIWSLLQELRPNPGESLTGDSYGSAVAISGNLAIVGAPNSDNHLGAAYLFERSGGVWREQEKLTASDHIPGDPPEDGFGSSVAISGNTTLVGAFGKKVGGNRVQGEAYISQIRDTDGDGLPDAWEINGITVDAAGVVIGAGNLAGQGTFINLPAMGADPMHKDIFIHADWMGPDPMRSGVVFKPSSRAIKMVIDAFAMAPVDQVNNPDHKRGINLHVDLGPDSIMKPGTTWGPNSRAGEVPFQTSTGSINPADGTYNWSSVDTIKDIFFEPANRRAVFHYALFCNNYPSSPPRSSGISRGIPAPDFIVALGQINGGSIGQQAGTFMHEFGHNLGLRHGGNEDINNKPNYVSIMNYTFQMVGLLNANGKQRSFDYSRTLLDPLNENNLDENVGINDPAMHLTLWKCPAPDSTYYKRFFPSRALDWNLNGVRNTSPVGVEINCDIPASLTSLTGFKDWPALIFDGGGKIGNAAGASVPDPMSTPADERSIEEILSIVPQALLDEELAAPLDVVTFSPQEGGAPLAFTFDGRASTPVNGTIVDWAWDFGDGTTGSGPTVTHTYTTPGDYYASLNVTDSTGQVNLVPLLNLVTVVDPASVPKPNLTPDQPPGWSDRIVVSNGTGMNTDSAPLTTADRLYIDWAVINNGNGPTTTDFSTALYVDGVETQRSVSHSPLLVNVAIAVQDYAIGPLSAGPHTIKIVADPDGAIAETGESDNEYSKIINISSSTPGPGDVDPTFAATATENNGAVYEVITQLDGKIIVGGFFESFAGCARVSVARINADGSCDPTFDPGLALPAYGVDAAVAALALQPDGKVLVGIFYSRFASDPGQDPNRKGIIRLNADGTFDTSFNASSLDVSQGGDGVESITVQADGRVLVSGSFRYNARTRDNFARLNPDGSVDASFHLPSGFGYSFTVTSGLNSASFARAFVQGDGKILIGGLFHFGSKYDPNAPHSLARLNSDGSLDATFNAHVITTDPRGVHMNIDALVLQSDGRVIATGNLQAGDGVTTYRIARINNDGTRDPGFADAFAASNLGSIATPFLRGLTLQPDGKVIVSGFFNLTAPAVRALIARLKTDGTLDTSFDAGITGIRQSVDTVALQTNGKVVVGGAFEDLRGAPAEDIFQFNPDGSRDPLFDSNGPGITANVQALVRQPDGKLLVGYRSISAGGPITKLNAARLNGIGRLNADGTTDPTFTSPLGSGASVYQIALQSDGKIIISGAGPVIGLIFARLNPNGTLDPSFVPSSDVQGFLALQSDGKILAFVNISSFSVSIGRLNTDGRRDDTFPDVTFSGSINAILVQPDGRLLVVGSFSGISRNSGFIERNNIARLNADGSVDTTFDPGAGTGSNAFGSGNVRTLILQPDGKIIIGGDFSSYNGMPRDRLARLNSDGSLDTSFNPVNPTTRSTNEGVDALALQPDGKVVVHSPYVVAGQRSNRIFRLNPDGSPDASFNPGAVVGENARVNAIVIQPDNNILIGGEFDVVNGVPRLALTRLLGSDLGIGGVITINTQPAGVTRLTGQVATFTVAISATQTGGGTPTISYQWQKQVPGGASFVDIPDATKTSYSTGVLASSDNGTQFRVKLTSPGAETNSNSATLTVITDTFAPQVVSVGTLRNANNNTTEIGIIFDDLLENAPATNKSNYSLNTGTITAARFVANSSGITSLEKAVVLTVTGMTAGNSYTLTVKGLSDPSGNTMPAPVNFPFTAGSFAWISIGRTTEWTPPSAPDAIATAPNGFNLVSGGGTFRSSEDDITMVYEEKTGDFDVQARVEFADGSTKFARSGISARASLNNGAPTTDANGANPASQYQMVSAEPAIQADGDTLDTSRRLEPGGDTSSFNVNATPVYPNAWLRLQRIGQIFNMYRGIDGTVWELLGSSDFGTLSGSPLPAKMFVGPTYGPENLSIPAEALRKNWATRIRDYGNVRGVLRPTISGTRTATGIRLTFTGTLYSATNVAGPYLPRSNAPGPTLEVPFSNLPAEFFQTR